MMEDTNTPYSQDLQLLASLGLKAWEAPKFEEVLIGEVYPYADHQPPGMRTKIAVSVTCTPAQFYKFVIERRADREDYDGMERIVVQTGSGSLKEYWPMALAVANNCLDVGVPSARRCPDKGEQTQ